MYLFYSFGFVLLFIPFASLLFVNALFAFELTGLVGLIPIIVVAPFTFYLACRFNSALKQVLIGGASVWLAMVVFAPIAMSYTNAAMEIDFKRQQFECIKDRSSAYEIFVGSDYKFITQPYALAVKNGEAFMWSFKILTFKDKWDEPNASFVHTCEN
jgi:hypothetical protein